MRISNKKIKRDKGFLYYVDKQGDISRAPMKRKGTKGRGKKEKVMKVGIKKQPGYLYYVDKQGYVAKVKMARGRKKRRR